MRKAAGAAALVLTITITSAWAENACVRPQEVTALQVAAVQQRFMVAALSCNFASSYNSFVTAFRPELQKSDETLEGYFLRSDPAAGVANYHRFKTKLANIYSTRSAENLKAFCRNARASFDAAFAEKKQLGEIVAVQPISFDESFASCEESVAGGAMVAQADPTLRANVAASEPSTTAAAAAAVAATATPAADSPVPIIAAAPVRPNAAVGALPQVAPEIPQSQNSAGLGGSDRYGPRGIIPPRASTPAVDPRILRQRANERRRGPYFDRYYPYGPGGYDYRYDNRAAPSNPYTRDPYAYGGNYGWYGDRYPYARDAYGRVYRGAPPPPPQYFQGR